MRIAGYDYTVIADPFLDCMGAHQAASLTIKLDARMTQQELESTLLHEIIEALKSHLRINIVEDDIMRLECGLYQVFRDAGVDLTPLLKDLTRA